MQVKKDVYSSLTIAFLLYRLCLGIYLSPRGERRVSYSYEPCMASFSFSLFIALDFAFYPLCPASRALKSPSLAVLPQAFCWLAGSRPSTQANIYYFRLTFFPPPDQIVFRFELLFINLSSLCPSLSIRLLYHMCLVPNSTATWSVSTPEPPVFIRFQLLAIVANQLSSSWYSIRRCYSLIYRNHWFDISEQWPDDHLRKENP